MHPSIIVFEQHQDSDKGRRYRRRAGRLSISDKATRLDVMRALNNGHDLSAKEVVTLRTISGKSVDIELDELSDVANQVAYLNDQYGRDR